MNFRQLPDKRKSRGAQSDPYPPDCYVRCTDDLNPWDLEPAQWTVTTSGRLMMRTRRGEVYDLELGALQ